jgi:hypothetical protein
MSTQQHQASSDVPSSPQIVPPAISSDQAPAGASAARRQITDLKRLSQQSRLSAEAKEQIVAELPSIEERERLFRELRADGGLSSDEFLGSLGLGIERQP